MHNETTRDNSHPTSSNYTLVYLYIKRNRRIHCKITNENVETKNNANNNTYTNQRNRKERKIRSNGKTKEYYTCKGKKWYTACLRTASKPNDVCMTISVFHFHLGRRENTDHIQATYNININCAK